MDLKIFNFTTQSNLLIIKKLTEYLTDFCDESAIYRLDNTEYLQKIESKVNNYVNLYAACDNTDFNWLI